MPCNKRQEFLKMLRAKLPAENVGEYPKAEAVSDELAEEELMALLEKKFAELFGPIDNDD